MTSTPKIPMVFLTRRTFHSTVVAIITLLLIVSLAFHSTSNTFAQQQSVTPKAPNIDVKEVLIVPDYSVQLLKFEAGEIDMVTVLPKDVERITKNRPDAQIIYIRPIHLTLGHLSFNVREYVGGKWNPWSIKELRQAMAHLINRDEIIAMSPLQGVAEKSTTIVSHRYGDWVNPDRAAVDFEIRYPYSLEKASELLDKAGFKRGPDGWRRDPRTGEILTLEIAVLPESVQPVWYYIALKYKENAEKVGVKVNIKTMSISELIAGILSRTLQSWLLGYYYGAYPTYYYYNYHSKEDRWVDGKPEGINYFGVRNETLDYYLDRFLYTLDINEAKRAFWKAQEILTDLVPTIPCYLPINIIAIAGKWKNITFYYAPPYDKPVDIYDPENPNTIFFDMNIYDEKKPIGGRFVDVVAGFSALNPLTSILLAENILENYIYDPLTVSNPNNIYDVKNRVKLLIEDWKVEPVVLRDGSNGTKLTVKLKKDVRWHDGVPMTVYDLEWTIMEAGVKRRLFWAYPEMVRQLDSINIIDPYTMEIYVKGRSWLYEINLLTFRPVPRHIWSKLPDLTVDPSREPHPSVKGLTLMTGNGRWILKEYIPGTKLVFVWNPQYHFKNELKKLYIDVVGYRSEVLEGERLSITLKVRDYLNASVRNARVVAVVEGPIRAEYETSAVDDLYKLDLGPLPAGRYSVRISASYPIEYGSLSGYRELTLNVRAAGAGVGATYTATPTAPTPQTPTQTVVGGAQTVATAPQPLPTPARYAPDNSLVYVLATVIGGVIVANAVIISARLRGR
jgi:ABC-type transport system substrate-binding protein